MHETQDRVVGDLAEEAHAALQLARLELRDQPDRPVEQADEPGEGRQPLVKGDELSIPWVCRRGLAGRRCGSLDDLDDRVALANLPPGDDAREPLQWSPTAR